MTAAGTDLFQSGDTASLRHGGAPADPAGYARGEAGRVSDGVWVVVWVCVEGSVVADLRYEVFGPPATLAVAEWLAARSAGRAAEDVRASGCAGAVAALGLPADRGGEALVVEDALWHALESEPIGG